MNIFHCSLILALGVSSLILEACAQECDTTGAIDQATGQKILRLADPDQLAVFENCTTITGHIVIEKNYSGDFILNGVTEFRGNISTEAPPNSPAQNLGLVELLNVTDIGNITLHGLIDNVHLPNLQRVDDVILAQTSPNAEVDLGSLVEATNVRIRGSWTSVNVQSLKTVNQVVELCGAHDCGSHPGVGFPYLEVDLPSLRATNHLAISGTAKSVSVPRLEVVGFQEPYPYRYQGLFINIYETEFTLNFNAPKLQTLNGSLSVYGYVSGLSLGALGETTLDIILNTDFPLNVYSTIKTARYFYLWGVLNSIYLPNVTDMGDFGPAYEPAIPCNETLYRLWESIPHNYSPNDGRCHRPDVPHDDKGTATNNQGTSNDTHHTDLDDHKSAKDGGPSSHEYAEEDENISTNKDLNNYSEDTIPSNDYTSSHDDLTNDNIDSEIPISREPCVKWRWPVSVGFDIVVQLYESLPRFN